MPFSGLQKPTEATEVATISDFCDTWEAAPMVSWDRVTQIAAGIDGPPTSRWSKKGGKKHEKTQGIMFFSPVFLQFFPAKGVAVGKNHHGDPDRQ